MCGFIVSFAGFGDLFLETESLVGFNLYFEAFSARIAGVCHHPAQGFYFYFHRALV